MMDEDFSFGASVWGTSSDTTLPVQIQEPFPSTSTASVPHDDANFDDFDDFNATDQTVSQDADDFGDFGDFGDGGDVIGSATDFGDVGFGEEIRISHLSSETWGPLRLDPMPSSHELVEQVNDILAPIWADIDPTRFMSQDDIRQVEGLNQILVTSESRAMHNTLFPSSTPPPTRTPNWTRSKIRRQHLIALGIPVNLDEILPHVNGKPLPTLQISTRPSSAPPGPRLSTNSAPPSAMPGPGSRSGVGTPRSGTPQSGGSRPVPSSAAQLSLGAKPQLDESKISKLLNLETDTLPLLPLAALEKHLSDLRAQTANTSTLLTHLLQTRDALEQDSETYNGLIAELVGEAQKMKTGKPARTAPAKRGSAVA